MTRRPSHRHALPALLLALTAASALAAPARWAWHWPVGATPGDTLVRITLPLPVYAQLQRGDLGDLAVLDAHGQPQPLDTLREAPAAADAPPPQSLPLFRIARPAAGGDTRIALQIQRGHDGRLTRLDAHGDAAVGDAGEDLLLDASALSRPPASLALRLAPEVSALEARVDVLGSHDLSRWVPLATGQAVLALTQDGLDLRRTELPLPATDARYLRLVRTDATAPLPVVAVEARWPATQTRPAPRHALTLTGQTVPNAEGVFDYRLPGPLAVTRLQLRPADGHGALRATVQVRDRDDAPWRPLTQLDAFAIDVAGEPLSSAPQTIAATRDRQWRIHTRPAQAAAPVLTLDWQPDTLLVALGGSAPHQLVAGSADAVRTAQDLQPLLTRARQRAGADWLPPRATLGEGHPRDGAAALVAQRPLDWRTWLLWGVLAGGALALAVLVLRLLREPPRPSA